MVEYTASANHVLVGEGVGRRPPLAKPTGQEPSKYVTEGSSTNSRWRADMHPQPMELLLPVRAAVSDIYPYSCMALLRDQLATWITLNSLSAGRAKGLSLIG